MSNSEISDVQARRVWDSRGLPTVEVEVRTRSGGLGRAIAPAGASCGTHEAVELRDGGDRLGGKDVSRAVANVEELIAPALRGVDARDQCGVDAKLDGLDSSGAFRTLGANASVATSLAVLHAGAQSTGVPLWRHVADTFDRAPSIPLAETQIFGGGAHASGRVDVQDFMIMVPGAGSFDESMVVTAEIYRAAGRCMAEQGRLAGVADEGGWWPNFDSNEQALDMLMRAIEAAGETPGERVVISLDIAATQLRHGSGYRMALEGALLDADGFSERIARWIERYPIVAIEDPFAEDAYENFARFRQRTAAIQVVGDDLLVTNALRVREAAAAGACNTALIKVNQAGTVSRAVAALDEAHRAGWRTIVSARSGESEDVSIVHLAVGLGAGQLKVGSFARSERMAKWNECVRIEQALGSKAFVAGEPLTNTWWARSGQRAAKSSSGAN
ncbi:enolase [Steroidobacter agaridevorans]|uniref:Enolase n=1 Tax=Steroidobacter agaridevorans TaxID=2695856 RepID=A0A829Y846_9GAMM|nr:MULTISPECIES: enolase C-terminal domain-like protein [Steroidobacteraceae]GFE79213.1 enolase [Steroidobacter agaridevorans]GFE87254.1 enolase [Steroidobacter agaridevorans]